jgi:hypothetical protein
VIAYQQKFEGGHVTLELVEQGQSYRSARATNGSVQTVVMRVWLDNGLALEQTLAPGEVFQKNLPRSPTFIEYAETLAFGVHVRVA